MIEKSFDGAGLTQIKNAMQLGSDFFRFLCDSCPIGIFSTDSEGQCTYLNPQCRSIWDCTLEAGLGDKWFQFIYADDLPALFEEWSTGASEGCEVICELRCKTSQAEIRWVRLRSLPVFDKQHTFNGFISIVEDITDERAEAEQAEMERAQLLTNERAARADVERVQQQLTAIFETSPIGIGLLDNEQRFVAINEALAEINGLSREQHLGHTIPELFGRFDPELVALFQKIYSTGELFISPQFAVNVPGRDDRRPGYYNVHYLPTANRSGTVEETLIYVVDVTERVRLEQGRTFLSEASNLLASSLDYQTTLEQVARLAVPGLADLCCIHIFEEDGSIQQLAMVHANSKNLRWTNELRQNYGLNLNAPRGVAFTLRTGESDLLAEISDELLVKIAQDARHLEILRQMELKSAMAVPLIAYQKVLGAISFISTGSQRRYDQTDLALVEELARRASIAIDNARLYRTAQRDRVRAESANRVKDEFLAVLSHELRTPLNPILGWTQLLRSRQFNHETAQQALETIERNAKLLTQLIEDLLDVSRILQGKLSLNATTVNLVSIIEAALDTVQLSAEAKGIDLRFEIANSSVDNSRTIHDVSDSSSGSHTLRSLIHRSLFQVSGDSARLQQLVWNLLSNAIKFTPEGGRVDVTLSFIMGHSSWVTDGASSINDAQQITADQMRVANDTQLKPDEQEQTVNYAQITVSDTGKGIHPDFLPHVFEYFRQEDSKTTRIFGGLGLGLAIVRHIVELHGGTVDAESPGEGLGATFVVRLPLLRQESGATDKPRSHSAPSIAHPLQGIRVLAVDDDEDMRELLTFILRQAGAIVTVAASGLEALAILQKTRPDVLLADIAMPQMDGYTLLRQIRERIPEQEKQIPAIAVTAYAGELNERRVFAAGFQHYISKPLEPDRLIQEIVQLLNG